MIVLLSALNCPFGHHHTSLKNDRFLQKAYSLLCFYFNSIFNVSIDAYKLDCYLPKGSRIERVYVDLFNKKGERRVPVIMCDISKDGFEYQFEKPTKLITQNKCCDESKQQYFIFSWTSSKLTILDSRFNFTIAIEYIRFINQSSGVKMWKIKGFDVTISDYK